VLCPHIDGLQNANKSQNHINSNSNTNTTIYVYSIVVDREGEPVVQIKIYEPLLKSQNYQNYKKNGLLTNRNKK